MNQTLQWDLDERTFCFAKNVALSLKRLPDTQINAAYIQQLIRSSASIGANYIEANDALGRKDFIMRIRIARKEAKESAYWIRLIIHTNDKEAANFFEPLMNEAIELKKILSAIINKCLKSSNKED